MFVEAARSLLESGRFEAAAEAIEDALRRKPGLDQALILRDELKQMQSALHYCGES